jgi:hypothetical protein
MADEILGKTYEVMTLVAIQDFTKLLKTGESIYWNEHPPGISIEPDLCIGKSLAKPRLILQIHHTAAESASHKKFWRNVGEFVEARLALGNNTAIGNIVFGGGGKLRLAKASDNLFDAFYEGIGQAYVPELLAFAERVTDAVKNAKKAIPVDKRPDHLRVMLKSDTLGLKAFRSFSTDLESLLKGIGPAKRSGWYGLYLKSVRTRSTKRIPKARKTSLRRGLGRLLPLAKGAGRTSTINDIKSGSTIKSLPTYFFDLGLVSKTLRGTLVSDIEITSACQMLTTAEIERILDLTRGASEGLKLSCGVIASIADLKIGLDFLAADFSLIAIQKRLSSALVACFDDGDVIEGKRVGLRNPEKIPPWIFDILMTCIKVHSGSQQGYGYTKLAREAGLIVPGKRSEIDFLLPKYLAREKNLDPRVADGLADAISTRIAAIGSSWLMASKSEVISQMLINQFEDKVYKSSKFDPCSMLVELALTSSVLVPRMATLLTPLGQHGLATCKVITSDKAIVFTQSASDAGVSHKVKELAGRCGMLRANRTPGQGYALVMDGTWTDKHMSVLYDAGFDAFFYPDEIDELKKWIANL